MGLPLNVDDTDLHPDLNELPAPKKGWTAMTFSLINIELAKAMQRLSALAVFGSRASLPAENVRAQIISETRVRIEEQLTHCNPVIPQQRLTLFCSRFLLRKLDFITRLQWVSLQRGGLRADFATEDNLVEALEILEPRLGTEDDLLKQFEWARRAYPQYHVTMYVLWHLCVKPEGPNIDRAWKAVDVLFSPELWDQSTIGFGSKLAVLTALKTKALATREKSQTENPGRNTAGRVEEYRSGAGGYPTGLLEDLRGEGLGFNFGGDEWPDWITLTQSIHADNDDVPWQ